jgi:hypothetical protein
MSRCEVCGIDYNKAITATQQGTPHKFDRFKCAIHDLALNCNHCGCRVIGRGVESRGRIFCGAHCVEELGGDHHSRSRLGSVKHCSVKSYGRFRLWPLADLVRFASYTMPARELS